MKRQQKRQNSKPSKCCYSAFLARVRDYLFPPSDLVNSKATIPKWRDISAVQKLAFYLVYMKATDMWAVSLDFSKEFMKKFSHLTYKKLKDVIRRRLNENFKNNLGFVPLYAFIIERKNTQLHIHGIIKLDGGQIKVAKQVMMITAFGSKYNKSDMKGYIVKIQILYNHRGWLRYMNKNPINALHSLYINTALLRLIKDNYCKL